MDPRDMNALALEVQRLAKHHRVSLDVRVRAEGCGSSRSRTPVGSVYAQLQPSGAVAVRIVDVDGDRGLDGTPLEVDRGSDDDVCPKCGEHGALLADDDSPVQSYHCHRCDVEWSA